MTYNIRYLAKYIVSLKNCNVRYIIVKQAAKRYLTSETMLIIAIYYRLSVEYSFMYFLKKIADGITC